MPHDGFLNLLKPPGMTSHDAVGFVRRHLVQNRVGHLGTLDPAAAGVLPIAVGRATRLFDYAAKQGKGYRAEVTFGVTTDSLDGEGRITSEQDASHVTAAQVATALAGLEGESAQVPPAYSAAQVGGKRLHELARQGLTAEAPARTVHFTHLELLSFQPGPRAEARLDVACSAGAYVRVLAEDLGRAVGCGAYLSFLLRTSSGPFRLEQTLTLEEIGEAAAAGVLTDRLLPTDWPLDHLVRVDLGRVAASSFITGTCVRSPVGPGWPVRVYGVGGFLGLGESTLAGQLRPRLILAARDGGGA
jgi:tRNA pseudouridine55 synthase